jgi:hypothetical protein
MGACKSNISAGNVLTIGDLKTAADAEDNEYNINQSSVVNGFISCTLGSVQKADLATAIANTAKTSSSTDTSNSNTIDQDVKGTTTVTKTDKTNAALEDMIASFNPFKAIGGMIAAIVICCICVSLILGIFMYMQSKQKK